MPDQTPAPESARALLYRHGLPEDVIDGALALHAQELAAVQRREAAVWGVDTAAGKHILAAADLIDPTRTASAAVPVPPPAGTDHRAQLLDALDFAYCQGLGYDTPEALLAAYDASRGVSVPPSADQADLLDRIADIATPFLANFSDEEAAKVNAKELAAAVLANLPEQTDRAAVYRGLADQQTQLAVADDLARRRNLADARRQLVRELRRVAAEEQPAETVLPAPVDRAALLRQEADQIRAHCPDHLDSDSAPGAWMVCHCDVADDMMRRLAGAPHSETPMFGTPDCTCVPFTRQGGKPRYCGPTDTVDMISGWEIGRDCPHHKPAVGEQPTEAHAPSHTWTVESPRRDNWASWGTNYDDRDWALERYESAASTAPQRHFRLVRATTTYVVEAEHSPRTGQTETQETP